MRTFYEIPFTQYLYPDGKRRPMMYQTESEAVFHKAVQIAQAGFRFECELVGGEGGLYHGTITSDVMDHASVLATNGPPLVPLTDKMILDFDIDAEAQRILEAEKELEPGK